MPRDITITFDDGEQHVYKGAPDDLTPEQVTARASQEFGKSVKSLDGGRAPQKPAGWLESTARDALTGFGQGAATLARGAQTAAGALPFINDQEGFGKGGTASNPQNNPLARMLGSAAESAEGLYQDVGSKSTNSPIVQGAVRGATGALTQGPGTVVNLAAGAGSGAAGEAMGKYSPNNPLAKTAAAVLGGVVAGTGAGMATRLRPQSADMAREAIEGISEQDLANASRYMQEAKRSGTDIDLAQALVATKGDAGNLESIRNALAQRTQGNRVQENLRAQPENLKMRADQELFDLPGTNYNQQQNANNAQETATAAIKAAKDSRSAAVKADYAQAGNLGPEARRELGSILNRYAAQAGATDVLIDRAREMGAKLSGKSPALDAAVLEAQAALKASTKPSERLAAQQALSAANAAKAAGSSAPLRALDVDTWIGQLRGPVQGGMPLKVAYPKEQGQIKGLAGELNKKFQELSPEVKAAEAKFRSITENEINPLTQGPVGTLSGRGYDPGTKAAVSNFESLLDKGTGTTDKISAIRTTAKTLGKENPTAFEDSFKGWLARKVDEASSSVSPGEPVGKLDPVKFYDSVFNKPRVWQGVKDAAETMAEVRGVDKTTYMRGLENFKQLTKALSSRADPTGISPQDMQRIGGSSATADFLRLASFAPMNRAGNWIEALTFGKTLQDFDKILTSPEGADMLMQLGRVPVMSKKAQAILGTWGGMVGNSDGLSNSNPPE